MDAASGACVINSVGIHQLLSLEVTRLNVLELLVVDGSKTVVDSVVKLVCTLVFVATWLKEDVDGVSNREDAFEDGVGVDVATSNGAESELLFASVKDRVVDWVAAVVWMLWYSEAVALIELVISEACWLTELLSESAPWVEMVKRWEDVVVGCSELDVWETDDLELVEGTGVSETWETDDLELVEGTDVSETWETDEFEVV